MAAVCEPVTKSMYYMKQNTAPIPRGLLVFWSQSAVIEMGALILVLCTLSVHITAM